METVTKCRVNPNDTHVVKPGVVSINRRVNMSLFVNYFLINCGKAKLLAVGTDISLKYH